MRVLFAARSGLRLKMNLGASPVQQTNQIGQTPPTDIVRKLLRVMHKRHRLGIVPKLRRPHTPQIVPLLESHTVPKPPMMVARVPHIMHVIQQLHPAGRHHAPLRGRHDAHLLIPRIERERPHQRGMGHDGRPRALPKLEHNNRDLRLGEKVVRALDDRALVALDVDLEHEDVAAVDAGHVFVDCHQRDPENLFRVQLGQPRGFLGPFLQ
mmetsp:Transcript_11480/g.29056  ORF Transcript_11480/g.29056 Transcript_11480/m.29056 type:complete len:210 (+) Transcript_11480:284-913(+)